MLKRRVLSLIMAIALFCVTGLVVNAEGSKTETTNNNSSTEGYEVIAQNNNFSLYADMKSGRFELFMESTGEKLYSNLTKEESKLDSIAKAKFKRNLESQIIITYRDELLKQEITIGSGTLKEGSEIKAKKTKNGINVTYNFEDLGIELTAEYRIDNGGFTASVKNKSIKESQLEKFKLISIEILPYFGAAHNSKNGYILVPDGSGALIYYNNGKTAVEQYAQRIYGDDATQMLETAKNTEETARLPVFGMKTNDSAFIAVVEKGAALTEIRANVSGYRNSYNSACGSYMLRATDLYSLGNSSSATTHKLYQEKFDKTCEYTIRYIPVTEAPFDYNSMAHTYRAYIMQKTGKALTNADEGLFAEIYGAVETQKTFLGIPYRAVTPLTTYKQVLEINSKLKESGVDEISFKYTNWDASNVKNKIPDKLRTVNKLGSKKDFNNMLKELAKSGTNIYLNLDFTRFTYSGHGCNTRFDSAVLLSKTTAVQKKFLLSTLYEDKEADWQYLLNLVSFKKMTEKYYKSASKLNVTGFALGSLGDSIYSDYDDNSSNRSITEKYFTDAAKIYSENRGILTDGGNAYMIPFSSFISSTPVSSSNFDIEDEEIPFYQLSLSGLVGMSTPPINQSGDNRRIFLKALESGISLGFLWFENDPFILKNTEHNSMYGASFEGWNEVAADYYAQWKSVRNLTGNGIISTHKNITEDVTATLFENGTKLIVNYSNELYSDENGNVIEPLSYSVIKGEA